MSTEYGNNLPPPNETVSAGKPANNSEKELKKSIFEPPLNLQRYKYVEDFLSKRDDISSVADLGCGPGRLLHWLKTIPHLNTIKMVEINICEYNWDMERYSPSLTELLFGRGNTETPLIIDVIQADILKPDAIIKADCIILLEVIEHIYIDQVEKLVEIVFSYYKPKYVLISTPNRDTNALIWDIERSEKKFRHDDHKFEFSREEFQDWANAIIERYPQYEVRFDGVGYFKLAPRYGPCTQIAIFSNCHPERETKSNPIHMTNANQARLLTTYEIKGSIREVVEFEPCDWQEDFKEIDTS